MLLFPILQPLWCPIIRVGTICTGHNISWLIFSLKNGQLGEQAPDTLKSWLCYLILLIWSSNSVLYPSLKYPGWNSILHQIINNGALNENIPGEASQAVLMPILLHQVRKGDRGNNQAQIIAEEIRIQWNMSIDTCSFKQK